MTEERQTSLEVEMKMKVKETKAVLDNQLPAGQQVVIGNEATEL